MSIEDRLYGFLTPYKKLPDWCKSLATASFRVLPRSFYLGSNYKKYYSLATDFEFASENDIEEFQFRKLKSVLHDAFAAVPYYRDQWNERAIDLSRIQSFADFKNAIPFIERKDIQNNPQSFISEKYSQGRRLNVYTGGSAGIPVPLFYLQGFCRSVELAHMHVLWRRAGYVCGERMARLRGDAIGNRFCTLDPWRNVLIMNSVKLNKANSLLYLKLMAKYHVRYITSYPSALTNLIQLSNEGRFPISSLKAIFLGSETVLDWQIETIRQFFDLENIFYWYGHGELCALAGICEKTAAYHFMPTYGYVEFGEKSDQGSGGVDDEQEIVATSFVNPLMPLIRYRTADYGRVKVGRCSCGRQHAMMSRIAGREQELAVGENGEKLSMNVLIHARHARYLHHISKMQLINTAPGRLIARIVPKEEFGDDDRKEIVRTLSHENGLPFSASVEIVDDIAPTSRGKHRLLVRTF